MVDSKSILFTPDGNVVLQEPLQIEDPTVGYRIHFFDAGPRGVPIDRLVDAIRFEPLPGDSTKQHDWEKNRTNRFLSSPRNFFKTLVNGSRAREGFTIAKDNVKNIDTTAYPSSIPNYFEVKFKGPVTVKYHHGNDEGSWTIYPLQRIYCTHDGFLLDDQSLKISTTDNHRTAITLLPLDYDPWPFRVMNRLKQLQERIYVQTDKPYYYPHETIWMKGYVRNRSVPMSDSISKTAYVELVNSKRQLVMSKTARIKDGAFATEMILPDTLSPGDYNLRAYTNFMRNFAADLMFIKPFPVLQKNERMEGGETSEKEMANGVRIKPYKDVYNTREKVQLSIQLSDDVDYLASLSVSITDLSQVKFFSDSGIVNKKLWFDSDAIMNHDGARFRVERGIPIRGIYVNDFNAPAKSPVTIIQGNMEKLLTVNTDVSGSFTTDWFSFDGTADFTFQTLDKQGNKAGHVKLLARKVPEIRFSPVSRSLQETELTQQPQRFFSDYEPSPGEIVLKEVTVTAKRETSETSERRKLMFTVDHVIYARELMGLNVAESLERKLIGFTVYKDAYGSYTILSPRGGSPHISPSPCLLLNGLPVTMEVINAYPVDMIDRVEYTSSMVNITGDPCNGAIAVYTRNYSNSSPQNKFQTASIKGYDIPKNFSAPDYSKDDPRLTAKDQRSTLYWNPNLSPNEEGLATISFYTSDRTGMYRVVVEGLSSDGELLRAVAYLKVTNR